jgi:hypothetical protein
MVEMPMDLPAIVRIPEQSARGIVHIDVPMTFNARDYEAS